MKMFKSHHQLFLASDSVMRKQLLKNMGIYFQTIAHQASEYITQGKSLQEMALEIAMLKMKHIQLPSIDNNIVYVLTADTMGQNAQGNLYGKPRDKQDAIRLIKELRHGSSVCTAFCLEKREKSDNEWKVVQTISKAVTTEYVFAIPDERIEDYLQHTPQYLNISGAITVEGYGEQFLKSLNGSYSTILGLPVCELREALEQLEFFN